MFANKESCEWNEEKLKVDDSAKLITITLFRRLKQQVVLLGSEISNVVKPVFYWKEVVKFQVILTTMQR